MSKRRRGGHTVDGFDGEQTTSVSFAEGTSVPRVEAERAAPGTRFFKVTIQYREPEFEARRGSPREHPFRWTYRIAAPDADEAAAVGVSQFQATAKLSQVSWRRDIVAVDAQADESDA